MELDRQAKKIGLRVRAVTRLAVLRAAGAAIVVFIPVGGHLVSGRLIWRRRLWRLLRRLTSMFGSAVAGSCFASGFEILLSKLGVSG